LLRKTPRAPRTIAVAREPMEIHARARGSPNSLLAAVTSSRPSQRPRLSVHPHLRLRGRCLTAVIRAGSARSPRNASPRRAPITGSSCAGTLAHATARINDHPHSPEPGDLARARSPSALPSYYPSSVCVHRCRLNCAQMPLASLARCTRCTSTSRALGPVDSKLTGRHRPLCLCYRVGGAISARHCLKRSRRAPRTHPRTPRAASVRAGPFSAAPCLSDVRLEWVHRCLLSATHEPLLALRTAAARLLVPSPAPRTTTRSSPLRSHRTVRTDTSAPYTMSSFSLPTSPTVRGLAHRPRCPAPLWVRYNRLRCRTPLRESTVLPPCRRSHTSSPTDCLYMYSAACTLACDAAPLDCSASRPYLDPPLPCRTCVHPLPHLSRLDTTLSSTPHPLRLDPRLVLLLGTRPFGMGI
jgi:hypothetical protein